MPPDSRPSTGTTTRLFLVNPSGTTHGGEPFRELDLADTGSWLAVLDQVHDDIAPLEASPVRQTLFKHIEELMPAAQRGDVTSFLRSVRTFETELATATPDFADGVSQLVSELKSTGGLSVGDALALLGTSVGKFRAVGADFLAEFSQNSHNKPQLYALQQEAEHLAKVAQSLVAAVVGDQPTEIMSLCKRSCAEITRILEAAFDPPPRQSNIAALGNHFAGRRTSREELLHMDLAALERFGTTAVEHLGSENAEALVGTANAMTLRVVLPRPAHDPQVSDWTRVAELSERNDLGLARALVDDFVVGFRADCGVLNATQVRAQLDAIRRKTPSTDQLCRELESDVIFSKRPGEIKAKFDRLRADLSRALPSQHPGVGPAADIVVKNMPALGHPKQSAAGCSVMALDLADIVRSVTALRDKLERARNFYGHLQDTSQGRRSDIGKGVTSTITKAVGRVARSAERLLSSMAVHGAPDDVKGAIQTLVNTDEVTSNADYSKRNEASGFPAAIDTYLTSAEIIADRFSPTSQWVREIEGTKWRKLLPSPAQPNLLAQVRLTPGGYRIGRGQLPIDKGPWPNENGPSTAPKPP